MILGIDKIHKLIKKKKLVDGLCERELKNPEGAGLDLRIGEVYLLEEGGFLGVNDRKTPKMKLIGKYEEGKSSIIDIKPNEYYVMQTIEEVNTPSDILIFKNLPLICFIVNQNILRNIHKIYKQFIFKKIW